MRRDVGAVSRANGSPANGAGNGSLGNGGATEPEPGKTKAAAEATTGEPVVPAKLQGLDRRPAFGQCGGMLQRTGSCYTCSSCGNNTGCG